MAHKKGVGSSKNESCTNACLLFVAAQERWLEISSVSNFETFQANRLKLRFKNSEGKSSWMRSFF